MGALAELRAEGKIRHVGLSNVTLEQVQLARTVVPIASVQNRFNIFERADDPVVDYCALHGIAYLPWGPLAAKPFEPGSPIGSASGGLHSIARELGVTPSQVALAWLLDRAPNIIPIPGTTSTAHLAENMSAARIHLSLAPRETLARLNGHA